ncbi:type IX secretion system sortase PorU [Gaetbulibacter aestuarii]|uniref:Type IX secretion system sortase PorU n=1 Tax=Gaetbulibacter aestuarii TaxID=1502358 RepID=A0ABW7MWU2_9FLAO
MKKVLGYILLMISVAGFAQQKTFNLNWDGDYKISDGNETMVLPAFDPAYFNFDTENGLNFIAQWETSQIVNEASLQISNVIYANLSSTELKDLDPKKIPSTLKTSLKNATARGKRFVILQMSPIIKSSSGSFQKVVSFQVSYGFGSNLGKISTQNKFSLQKGVSSSVLSSGLWYKFYIDSTGVYKLSKDFIRALGVSVDGLDPRTVKIYGNGGAMIPYTNQTPYPIDVQENAIEFVGESDGVFNDDDYILFFADGPKQFNSESNTHINCYTDKTYYYLNISPGNGKRIQAAIQPQGTVDMAISTFDDYQFYEEDNFNIANLGRRWFADRFDIENLKTLTFNLPNLVTTEPVHIKVLAAAASASQSTMDVRVNSANVASITLPKAPTFNLASDGFYDGDINVSGSVLNVALEYNNQGNPSAKGYLDYVSIEAVRGLTFNDKQFLFQKKDAALNSGIASYTLSNASNVSEVWDVTDKYNVTAIKNTDANNSFTFNANLGTLRKYQVVTSLDFYQPQMDSDPTLTNQDLKGTIFNDSQGQFQDIDYVIITPVALLSQAERLAAIHKQQSNLNVKVVTLDLIYNEFSTGNPDIGAIRNFIKYVYDNPSTTQNRVKYVCLFGDGSFDYKDRIPNNTNIVPSWYSYNSFSETNSFVSDDFYGMMDPQEGTMVASDKLDIAVGRILADSPQRAQELVDKIATYYEKKSFGSWRNNYVVVSDDVDQDWEGIIEETSEAIANEVVQNKPFINIIKIYADAYKQETSAGGERYPQVNTALVNAIDTGALIFNYFGHGGEDALAQERIFLKPDIENLRNFNKLHCFVTVTCEFTKFDNPYRETAGELIYWNKQAGSIGLITTTRQVFVTFGINFNKILGQYLFSYSTNDTFGDYEYPTMAEALRLAKNNIGGPNLEQKRLVFFIGDPAMTLAFPKPRVRLTSINDVPVGQATDTLKALSYVKLAGEVTDISGNLLTNYNGVLSTTIFDKNIQRQTLANDGTRNNGVLVKMDFETLGEIIFRGQASVKNGQFAFDFVVPKDIGIPVGFGKVSFYSENDAALEDQTGASVNTVKIGGLNENAVNDNTGPIINLFMNDESFVSGGITNESPTLLAKLSDENGINTASGVGHDIVAILDGDETNPFILNDYYQTEVDDYTKGLVTFPFRDLAPGLHTLTLKAWDVFNNSSIQEIQFIVYDKDQSLVLENVLNYPNPFVNYTEFWFNHNSSAPLDVSIQIFTVSGKLVRTLQGQTTGAGVTTSTLSRDIIWDGRDDFGDKLGKGVYIYKLTVYSSVLDKRAEKIEKLVIL